MILPGTKLLRQNDTHRLISSNYGAADGGVLSRIAEDDAQLKDIIDLDSATAREVTLSVPSGTNGSRLVAFVQDPKSGHVLAVALQKL